MKKTTALKIINPIIGVLFITQSLSGIFHASLPYELYVIVHGYAGYLFAGLVALHIFLNWAWFKTTFFTKKKTVITKA